MRKVITNRLLETVKPTVKRQDIRDASFPGFGVRVTTNGRKTFYLSYRWGLEQRHPALGIYPIVSLAKARERAVEILRLVDDGVDPEAQRRRAVTDVQAAVADFIRSYAKPRNKSWREAERILMRELVVPYGPRDIRSITKADILDVVDAASERGALYQANRIHAHTRKFLNWCAQRGMIEANPILGIAGPSRERARDRVLADDEIARIVKAVTAEPFPFGPFVLLLLATAQRRGELAEMRWSQIDRDAGVWKIPAHLAKNGKPNTVPLSPFALRALDAVPRFEACDLVFSTNRRTPVSGFSKMLRRISEASNTSNWRLHDLRRTAASGMARAGVAPHIVEKVLNHISGEISGVAAVYNRYGYTDEKRVALDGWGTVLEGL
jgi:integrase